MVKNNSTGVVPVLIGTKKDPIQKVLIKKRDYR
jgi:hypothetical protein